VHSTDASCSGPHLVTREAEEAPCIASWGQGRNVHDEPAWVRRHALTVGASYYTKDSDLAVEYVGVAQVRDRDGFRMLMVFREVGGTGPMLTLTESDAAASAGFTALGDHLLGWAADGT
jgi:hypothetical protein